MELVPFLDNWTKSGTTVDIKAIYRRPDPNGVSLTGPLPLRRHSDWAAKGLQYVSLASLSDLGTVAPELRAHGHDPLAMKAGYDRNGNFDIPQYLKEAKAGDAAHLADLQAKVDKFGPDAVTEMMRMNDPAFTLPASIVVKEPELARAKGK